MMLRLRHGFTLVEMLTVIGILMLLLALSIGAVLNAPRANALVGTEQLVSDLVRQARHTARSSGAPVMIEITKDDRQVMGVSQIPLWGRTFDENDPSVPTDFLARGRSGLGYVSKKGPGGFQALTPPDPLDRSHQLGRPSGARVEGFYLSCSALPPAAPGVDEVEPLILIGGDQLQTGACGLILKCRLVNIQSGIPGHDPAPPYNALTFSSSFLCWDLVGWVGSEAISSIDDGVKHAVLSGSQAQLAQGDQQAPARYVDIDRTALDSGEADVAGPIIGGAWEDFGLLFDGSHIELYRNGRMIAVRDGSGVTVPTGDFVQLGFGRFQIGGSLQDRCLMGTLDDARLMRLGVDRAGTLPTGVKPASDYRLTARPDGRIDLKDMLAADLQGTLTTVNGNTVLQAAPAALLTFVLGGTGSATDEDRAEITVYPDGRVQGEVKMAGTP